MNFLSPSTQITDYHLKLHSSFLPHPYQFIIHTTLSYDTKISATESTVTKPINAAQPPADRT